MFFLHEKLYSFLAELCMVIMVTFRKISASSLQTKGESLTIETKGFNTVVEDIRRKGSKFSLVTEVGPDLLQDRRKSGGD